MLSDNQMGKGWVFSPYQDVIAFVLPVMIGALFMSEIFPSYAGISQFPILFLVMTLLIDSAHVYSTLWRTYFDKRELTLRRRLYILAPLFAIVVLGIIVSISLPALLTFSAYAALTHFIRQQYGWMMVASAKSGTKPLDRRLDKIAIYSVTLYPIIWCHMTYDSKSPTGWFLKHDLALGTLPDLTWLMTPLVSAFLVVYIARQFILTLQNGYLATGKIIIFATTWFAWWAGTLLWSSDRISNEMITFAHGFPYLLLIYRDGKVRHQVSRKSFVFNSKVGLVVFMICAFIPAYFEEFFRNAFYKLWPLSIFPSISTISKIQPELSELQLSIILALLFLPALIHFILDAFLWTKHHYRF